MDNRSREARRLAMVSTNGFSRRRHRSATSEGGGHVELPDMVKLRDRMVKKDRDRDRDSMLSKSKRRRSSHSMHREEDEESTDESVGNEQDYEDSGVSRRLSPHTASSVSDHSHRGTAQPARHGRQPQPPPVWKVSEEMIGVPVPRKARSASGKRSHENWVSAGGNVGGDDTQPSNSPARMSFETVSPSSSNITVRKKAKKIGSKIQLSETEKSPSSTQEDIEIEIAGLLCDLMASKKSDSPPKSEPNGIDNDSKKEVLEIACSMANSPNTNRDSSSVPKIACASSDPSSRSAQKNNNGELAVESLSTLAVQSWIGPKERVQHAKEEAPSRESAYLSETTAQVPKLDGKHEKYYLEDGADRKPVSEKEKSPSADRQEQEELSSVSQSKSKREEKFEIDLMALPPMTQSPEQEGTLLGDLNSESKPVSTDVGLKDQDLSNVGNKVERQLKNEVIGKLQDERINTRQGKREFLKLDLDKSNPDEVSILNGDTKGVSWKREQNTASSVDALKSTAQSTVPPSVVAAAGWQNGLPPFGYMPPPFNTFASMDGIMGSSISPALQHPRFSFSQPKLKRCATHQTIARSIALHQQLAKTIHFWPGAVSSTLLGAEPNMLHGVPPAEKMDSEKQMQRTLVGVNLDSGHVKGGAAQKSTGLAGTKTLGSSNLVDSTQTKQLVMQQSTQPTSTGGLMCGPAYIYPPSQHQAPVVGQHGPANFTRSASKSENSAAGSLGASSGVPGVATTVSSGYPNLANNRAPYMTMLHKKGYPFPFPAPVGTVPAIKGESSAQTMPVINGPYYSSQMFHPSHFSQQSLIQPANHAIGMSSKASSSHKQQHGTPVTGNKMLTPTSLQLQQPQLHASLTHQSRKVEGEINGEGTQSLVGRTPYSQNGFHGQSFTVPAQPLNFSLKASIPSGSNAPGNYSEKHQSQQQQRPQGQQKTHKGGVELVPTQAFAISFASFNGAGGAPSSLYFSSTAQNPVIFQSLPDVAQGHMGYHVPGVSPSTQPKNHSASDGKILGRSTHADDEKKGAPGKLSNPGPTTLVFDNSSRTLNFMSSSVVGSWPSHSITSTIMTTSAPLAGNASCAQQSHVLQHQKKHLIQHQQHAVPGRTKTSTVNTPSTGTAFPNNPLVFSQTPIQCNGSVPSPPGRNSGRASESQAHHSSRVASTTTGPTQTSFIQQGRVLTGRTQISFGGISHPEGVLPAHTQAVISNQPSPSNTDFSPNGCNLRSNQQTSKSGPLQMQQTDNHSAGTGQKSSPVCGRNMSSILSTCPSHISELKY